jgi:hypothetical protein
MKKTTGFILMGLTIMFVLMLFAGPVAAVLIVDGDFNASGSYIPGDPHEDGDPDQASSLSLRANGTGQDWYESRAYPLHPRKLMLYSNTSDGVFGNYTNMARLRGEQDTPYPAGSAYLTQDFDAAQNGTFSLYFDIAIDSIYNRSSGSDATGFIYVGNDDGGTFGPNSPNDERFVYMGFYDSGGGTSGQSLELRANNNAVDVFGLTNLWYDTWYTVTLDIDVVGNTYDVTVDDKFDLHSNGILTTNGISAFSDLNSLTSLSFMVGGTGDVFGNGTFFVDNVSEVPIPGGIWLLGSGLIGIVGIRRKFKK